MVLGDTCMHARAVGLLDQFKDDRKKAALTMAKDGYGISCMHA